MIRIWSRFFWKILHGGGGRDSTLLKTLCSAARSFFLMWYMWSGFYLYSVIYIYIYTGCLLKWSVFVASFLNLAKPGSDTVGPYFCGLVLGMGSVLVKWALF